MAGTVRVVIADDLDGSPGARAVAVSFGGRSCQFDLGKKNRVRFRKSPQPLTDAGRRGYSAQGGEGFPGYPSGPGRAAVRAWAAGQGLRVPERGRISAG